MNFYFAPMEGLTGYIYRNAHNTFFNKDNTIDKYFSPFIMANQSESFKTKELQDILPENNQRLNLIPQILSNNAKDFIHTSKKLNALGYNEINLNLGCPSATVVSKGRGSGFLAKTQELEVFLDEIFTAAITKISIKTRLGKEDSEEFYPLIQLFNKYPMEELIVHPRIQKDFYKNKPNLKVFKDALDISNNPVVYNGDIFTVEDYARFVTEFTNVSTVMIGRGVLVNPALVNSIINDVKLDKALLKEFHDKLYDDYKSIMFGDRNVLFKMKEIWFYMSCMFSNYEKYAKKIRKAEKLRDYDEIVTKLFGEQDIVENKITL